MTPVSLRRVAALAALLAAIAGCANTSRGVAGHDHGTASASAAGHSHGTDQKAMCEHHRQMASNPDHHARMQEHMKGMSAEKMQQHMQEMQEKCK